MSIEFPTEVSAYTAPFAVALVVAIVIQLLIKPQLGEGWRWTSPISLVLGEVVAVAAGLVMAGGKPDAAQTFSAVMVGFFGWALAVAGYEGIVNILGLLGKGPRSEKALRAQALVRCEKIMTPRMPARG